MKWLLLRGLTREQRHWGPFREKFDAAFGSENVHCLDHIAVGTEAGRRPVYSIAAMTADLRARWLQLRGSDTGPWAIVSLSMGSMVSLSWCASFAKDFDYQFLMNVSSSKDSTPWQRILLSNVPTFTALARAEDKVLRERKILDMCTNMLSDETKNELAETWAKIALPKAQIRRVAVAQLVASSRFRRPSKVTVPTLAMASAADRLVDPTCTMRIAEALGLMLEIHPTAGHELAIDDPDWVIARIQAFLKNH
ncbi:MAG TPA: alpha/beta hydrolase [Bdellovibrionota bacterium]|jgi:pimeloyl-ACP methyl ester carboxylesterase|nr:alpha/beta hydrolase [Bdellovibrionota bacterium]